MRVVNSASLYVTGTPAKCGSTLSTKHLITSVNFENQSSALGTRFTILRKEASRLDALRLAGMRRVLILTLDFVTFWTRPLFTQSTLPCSGQKSAATFSWTRADERPLGFSLLVKCYRVTKLVVLEFYLQTRPLLAFFHGILTTGNRTRHFRVVGDNMDTLTNFGNTSF